MSRQSAPELGQVRKLQHRRGKPPDVHEVLKIFERDSVGADRGYDAVADALSAVEPTEDESRRDAQPPSKLGMAFHGRMTPVEPLELLFQVGNMDARLCALCCDLLSFTMLHRRFPQRHRPGVSNIDVFVFSSVSVFRGTANNAELIQMPSAT